MNTNAPAKAIILDMPARTDTPNRPAINRLIRRMLNTHRDYPALIEDLGTLMRRSTGSRQLFYKEALNEAKDQKRILDGLE